MYSPKDAEDFVFFISAKETLQARLQEQRGQPAHSNISRTAIYIFLKF